MVTDDPNNSGSTLEALRRENERLRASLQQSNAQLTKSSRANELLRAERDEFLEQLKQRDRKIDDLQHQVQALLRRYYARSSEKMDPNQRLLFEDLIDKAIPEMPGIDCFTTVGRACRGLCLLVRRRVRREAITGSGRAPPPGSAA